MHFYKGSISNQYTIWFEKPMVMRIYLITWASVIKKYVSVIKLLFVFFAKPKCCKPLPLLQILIQMIHLLYIAQSCVFHYIINQFSICQMLLLLLNDTTKLCHKLLRKVCNPTTNERKKQHEYIIVWLQKRIRLHLN